MGWALSCFENAKPVAELLDLVEKESEGRPEFTHGLKRERVEGAIHALLWAYGCRPSDTAFCYAMDNLYVCLGIDWRNSTIAWLPEDPTGTDGESTEQNEKGK